MKNKNIIKPLTAAQQQLVINNMAFADKLARKFRALGEQRGFALDDLTQESRLGLCYAAADFNPEQGVTFVTFAFDICRKQIQLLLGPKDKKNRIADEDVETLNVIDYSDDQLEMKAQVDDLLQTLDNKEREVITRRFGIEGNPMTFKEIGESLGLTSRRVHQIYEKAMNKLELTIH